MGSGPQPEFDALSSSYEEILKDPIRERFTGGGCEFFHTRKADLIRQYFGARKIDLKKIAYLDFGCGRGELLSLLHADFASASGCDPSAGMMDAGGLMAKGIHVQVQSDHGKIPFADRQFDFVTAVCVYHHVPPPQRDSLTAEVRRVLKPGGIFAIIEHNPVNPIVRLIVSRTPVDANAILLRKGETEALLRRAGLEIDARKYFLYVPQRLYRPLGFVETLLQQVPLGGQYVVFGRVPLQTI